MHDNNSYGLQTAGLYTGLSGTIAAFDSRFIAVIGYLKHMANVLMEPAVCQKTDMSVFWPNSAHVYSFRFILFGFDSCLATRLEFEPNGSRRMRKVL